MKNNNTGLATAKIVGAMAALLLASGQASAHVGYGHALYDDSGVNPGGAGGTVAEETIMHLASGNKGAQSTQTLNVTSNAGFAEANDPKLWGNTHDNRFMWLYVSKATKLKIEIQGNANTNWYNTPANQAIIGTSICAGEPADAGDPAATPPRPAKAAWGGCAIDTLRPAFALFAGKAPPSAHDGAYGSFNTGFAPWSSWAQQALPAGQPTIASGTKFTGVGNASAEGNPVEGRAYTTDGTCPDPMPNPAVPCSYHSPSSTIPAGTTGHMGVYGNYMAAGTGPNNEAGFWLSNNVTQVTYPDGSPSTEHSAFLKFVTRKAELYGTYLTATVTLKAGVYSLVVGGNNAHAAEDLVARAMATGMGPEGCTTDANTNCANGSTASPLQWALYKKVDRANRSFTITVTKQ